ncbi:MAG: hypothetical protein E6Q83_16750 [Thiothrix sp.]|nr:MAG: hypothetical protein E6Q83_16750 [Thiothrix sp.]
MSLINRHLYPELNRLLWDIHSEWIEPELAFRVYEDRWGFVTESLLEPAEQILIQELTTTVGNGIFLPHFQ